MKLSDLPAITFAAADPQELDLEIVSTVEALLKRKLERADPLRIFLRGVEMIILQQRLLIDQTAKQNLLAYATGENLDHLGALVGCQRLEPSKAVTTCQITLSTVRSVSTTIKKGTRITADDQIYFELDEDVLFPAGTTSKTAKAQCTEVGEAGNGYASGELNRIVDPQAFLLKIENLTTSAGGADIESDDAYRQRIHEAPEAFSCAGSEGAYIYHAKSVNQLIGDVAVHSPEPGKVEVYILMKGGQLPEAEILTAVDEYLNAKTVRPLTDTVAVLSPAVHTYDIDVSYFINRADAVQAAAIDEAAQAAVNEFIDWQRESLGRDLNPDELIYRLKKVGVKRVEVRSPLFTKLTAFEVAVPISVLARFEGLEDD